MQVDPKAVAVHDFSPYSYANGNPVLMNDPHGDLVKYLQTEVGAAHGSTYDLSWIYSMWATDAANSEAGGGTQITSIGAGETGDYSSFWSALLGVVSGNSSQAAIDNSIQNTFSNWFSENGSSSSMEWNSMGGTEISQENRGAWLDLGGDPNKYGPWYKTGGFELKEGVAIQQGDQHEWQTWQGLTDSEKALVKSNPDAAWTIYGNRQVAFQATEALFKNISQHNTAADAFRHAFFNALNARDVGSTLARQFSEAHESDPNNPIKENIMDTYNNMIGNQLGANSNSTSSQLMIQVYNQVKTGGLYMIDNGSLVKTHWP